MLSVLGRGGEETHNKINSAEAGTFLGTFAPPEKPKVNKSGFRALPPKTGMWDLWLARLLPECVFRSHSYMLNPVHKQRGKDFQESSLTSLFQHVGKIKGE